MESRKIGRVVLALGFLAVLAVRSAFGGIVVQGNVPFTDTGVYVPAGSEITINATGLVTFDLGGLTSDPDGNSAFFGGGQATANFLFVIPDIPALSLIGAIGDSLPVVTFGNDPEARADLDFASTTLIGDGFIGSSFQGLAPASGWLYLGYNDRYFEDNSGAFVADIDIQVVPVPAALLLGIVGVGVAGMFTLCSSSRRCGCVACQPCATDALKE